GQGGLNQIQKIFFGEWIQGIHLAAGEERGVDFEGGVFRGSADQGDGALFHGPEERVLLGFVEAVNFVDRSEEHTSELQSREKLVCRLLLEKKKIVLLC